MSTPGFNLVDATTSSQGQHVDANGSAQVMLYDQFGNPLAYQNKTAPAVPISGVSQLALDEDKILRIPRVSEFASLAGTSALVLWQDIGALNSTNTGPAFSTEQSSSITSSATTSAPFMQTINNEEASTGPNAWDIWTTNRQFQKYPRIPLWMKLKAIISGGQPGNLLIAEIGFGAPTTNTPAQNGVFFRMSTSGALLGVITYNGTENTTVLVPYGTLSNTSYYSFEIIVDDDYATFIVSDSSDNPIVNTIVRAPTATPCIFGVSHLPVFMRIYDSRSTSTAAGNFVQIIYAFDMIVALLDGAFSMPFAEQQALTMRPALIGPLTGTQTNNLASSAPGTVTPSNIGIGYYSIGGEAALALTTASENLLYVWGFSALSSANQPSFMLTGIFFQLPFVTTAISVTGIPVLEWFVNVNNPSTSISAIVGGGQVVPLGVRFAYSSITQAAGTYLVNEGALSWIPKTPMLCLPNTFIMIGYKLLNTSAVSTAGVTRHACYVDGYYL